MIESMDHALGSKGLSRGQGPYKNTVVPFMSDNGGLSAVVRGGENTAIKP